MFDVIVIGSGPAGMAAALYTARAGYDTRIITGPQLGGQVSLTTEIDNYLALPDDLTGSELVERMVRHVEKVGAELVYDEVTGVDFRSRPLNVTTYSDRYDARAIVVASGASARHLGVPGEEELIGRGVSYCGTCDGAFFKGHDVLVVGGGDSAIEEGIYLTRFADSVRVVHRRDELRAAPHLQERAFANDRVSFIWNTVVDEITGDGRVERVRVSNVVTGDRSELEATGVFIFIGHDPNTGLFRGVLDADENGYLKTDAKMRASVEGVFAAGEVADPVWRQVGTSVGQGSMAGMTAVQYLQALE